MKRYRKTERDGGLFSAIEHEQAVAAKTTGILKLRDVIPRESLRPLLEELTGYATRDWAKGGKPPFDPVLMFKVLVLQKFHVLSDDANEEQIFDLTSFKNFLGLRIGDDIAGAVAPSMRESTCDLYVGMGDSPEGILAAAALKCLGGDMQMRMWFHDEAHRAEVAAQTSVAEMNQVFRVHELIIGESALFCATGISDSPLLPGCRLFGHRVETHSILMRSRSGTVRRIHAVHDLDRKVVPLRA